MDSRDKQADTQLVAKIFRGHELILRTTIETAVEFGRQRQGEPDACCELSAPDGPRVVVANLSEAYVSRKHFVLTPLPDGRVEVANTSSQMPILLDATGGGHGVPAVSLSTTSSTIQTFSIPPGESMVLTPSFLLVLSGTSVRVESETTEQVNLVGLDHQTITPGQGSAELREFGKLFGAHGEADDRESVLDWLERTMSVFQQSATSPDFLTHAAKAVVDTVGLDIAAILTQEAGAWEVRAVVSSEAASEASWRPSQTILGRVLADKKTFRQLPELEDEAAASLLDVTSVVAAPILNEKHEVVGALYGDRRQNQRLDRPCEVSALEAKLVELLASAVASGLARLEQERLTLASRVRFEQFFTPELSRELEQNDGLLEGRDAEVSLLFGDIGGFSRISERLGPRATVEWINSVLNTLSQCVARESGVLVDYVGDELFGMWGAPGSTPDHASLACRAALSMQATIAEIDAQWMERTGEPFQFGIGINTGVARVGNVGSRLKFKYGPLGNSVNLASRIQGATKHLRSPILITGSTAAKLDKDEFAFRRLCQIKVVNIEQPVEVFELSTNRSPEWVTLRDQYEAALNAFESTDFSAAAKLLGGLLTQYPEDGPSVLLLSRVASLLASSEDDGFDPVWELSGK